MQLLTIKLFQRIWDLYLLDSDLISAWN